MLFRKIICALKMLWFGFHKADFLVEQNFVAMATLYEHIIKTVTDDRPYQTHLFINNNRVASLWCYPGLSKNPTDRITELLSEITALKESVELHTTQVKSSTSFQDKPNGAR